MLNIKSIILLAITDVKEEIFDNRMKIYSFDIKKTYCKLITMFFSF